MKIIGHRGARGLAPENTVAGLIKAIKYGVDEVEFDVRVTSDGIPVLHHNPALTDRAGNQLKIDRYTYKVLKSHKDELTTLEEAAYAVNRVIPMLIEVKPGVNITPIVKTLNMLLKDGWKPTDMIIESRNYRLLRALHKSLPSLPTMVLDRWSGVRAASRARRLGTKRLGMNQIWLWRGFISSMHRRGWELYPYTINNTVKAHEWSKYGIAGVITDFPNRFEDKKSK